jgi:hypothetical protein
MVRWITEKTQKEVDCGAGMGTSQLVFFLVEVQVEVECRVGVVPAAIALKSLFISMVAKVNLIERLVIEGDHAVLASVRHVGVAAFLQITL